MAGIKFAFLALLICACPAQADVLKVTATAYYAGPGQGQYPYDEGALGTKIIPYKTVAVSRDLRHLLGQEIYIIGLGWRFVNDLTGPQWRKRIDLVREDREACEAWGVRKVTIKTEEEFSAM